MKNEIDKKLTDKNIKPTAMRELVLQVLNEQNSVTVRVVNQAKMIGFPNNACSIALSTGYPCLRTVDM